MARSKAEPLKRWRVGNFVLRLHNAPTFGEEDWSLSDAQVVARVRKGEIGTVEVLEASSLDGAWMMRFMPGSMMSTLLLSYLDGGDGVLPDKEWLELVLTNLMGVSSIPNGHFHQAITLLMSAYCDPSLLGGGFRNKRARQFRRDMLRLRDEFLSWRKEYDKLVLTEEEDEEHAELAQKAQELLEVK